MKILIVEDDANKSRELYSCLAELMPHAALSQRGSYQSGLKAAIREKPDLMVLDMTMPTFDVSATDKGGRTRTYAGMDILHEMRRRGSTPRVIVVTQFESFGEGADKKTLEELKMELGREFPANYIATIYYHPSATNWRRELEDLVKDLRPA